MTRRKIWIIALVVLLIIAACAIYFIFVANSTHVYNGTLVKNSTAFLPWSNNLIV